MYSLRKYIFYLLVFVLVNACTPERFNQETDVFSITLTVHYPAYYLEENAENVKVRLTNISNGLYEEKISNSFGEVLFEDVIHGKYTISAFLKLNTNEALDLGEIIFTEQDIVSGKTVNLTSGLPEIVLEETSNLGGLTLQSSIPGELLIKEVFYTGTSTPNGKAYWSDQFVEIYNNSDHIIYADSLHIADVYGPNGVSSTSHPTVFQSDQEHVYLNFVWMVPGDGSTYPINPGESIVIAQDGLDHKNDPNGNPNSINLSKADFETFVLREDQRDVDVVGVANMIEIFAKSSATHDWILHSAGSSIVIYKVSNPTLIETVPEPESTTGKQLLKVPASIVLDAFEALAKSEAGSFKRIPNDLDGGFIYCGGIFNAQSCRRKIESRLDGIIKLQDLNNSTIDFEVIPFPTPKEFE